MGAVIPGRFAGRLEGEFAVFVIGMRINNLLAVTKWMPVSQAMPRMLKELAQQPELGLLHAEPFITWRGAMVLQYWRSYEQLHAYAHAKDRAHLPAWIAFQQAARGNTAVGVYHETYRVTDGRYESVYVNMPAFGLAKAGESVPAVGSMKDAAARMRGQQEATRCTD